MDSFHFDISELLSSVTPLARSYIPCNTFCVWKMKGSFLVFITSCRTIVGNRLQNPSCQPHIHHSHLCKVLIHFIRLCLFAEFFYQLWVHLLNLFKKLLECINGKYIICGSCTFWTLHFCPPSNLFLYSVACASWKYLLISHTFWDAPTSEIEALAWNENVSSLRALTYVICMASCHFFLWEGLW